jgi:hypothetical protein
MRSPVKLKNSCRRVSGNSLRNSRASTSCTSNIASVTKSNSFSKNTDAQSEKSSGAASTVYGQFSVTTACPLPNCILLHLPLSDGDRQIAPESRSWEGASGCHTHLSTARTSAPPLTHPRLNHHQKGLIRLRFWRIMRSLCRYVRLSISSYARPRFGFSKGMHGILGPPKPCNPCRFEKPKHD